MSRQITLQREQIAILKAFGYSNLQVGLHFMKFAFVIVALGIGLGTAGGFWLGDAWSIFTTNSSGSRRSSSGRRWGRSSLHRW